MSTVHYTGNRTDSEQSRQRCSPIHLCTPQEKRLHWLFSLNSTTVEPQFPTNQYHNQSPSNQPTPMP
jgi:hypothetical protein